MELTCILCPRGCLLQTERLEDGTIHTRGAGCSKGIVYAEEELTHPVRVVTTTVHLENADLQRLPVKTASPVPKESIMAVAKAAREVRVFAPVLSGSVVAANVAGTGVDLVATRTVRRRAGT